MTAAASLAMVDKLLSDVASKILNESLHVKKGETVTVETWNTGLPLALEVVKKARRIGCIPIVLFEDEQSYVDGVVNMPKDVLGAMGRHEYASLTGTDAYVFIPGPPLSPYYKGISREDYANSTKYNNSWYEAAEKAKLKGVRLSFGYVGSDLALYLGKSVNQIARAQLKAALVDFKQIRSRGLAQAAKLHDGSRATLKTEGCELRFMLRGTPSIEDGIVDDEDVGKGENMAYLPPGMVTIDVDKDSATGTVRLSPSLTRLGLAPPLSLKFEKGRLAEWSSARPARMIATIMKTVKESDRAFSFLTLGLNERVPYGFGQDRFASGSVTIGGFGFVGVMRNASLKVEGTPVIANGKPVTTSA